MITNSNGKCNANSGKVQINGHEYLTVAYRLAAFRAKYPIELGWTLETEPVRCDAEKVTFKAIIKNHAGQVVATGHAEEKRGDSWINRTSALENAETSAIGRALASAGFIGNEFASAEEVALALQAQASQASKAEGRLVPKETKAQAKAPICQAARQAQAKPAEPTKATPPSDMAEPDKQAATPQSQTARQAQPGEASQPKQSGQTRQTKPVQPGNGQAEAVDEERAQKWLWEHLPDWLDEPCPFKLAGGRTWRELGENMGEKIPMNGKGLQPPRAYLHALENWQDGQVWTRLKARVALDAGKQENEDK